ncbi:MAG: hypothetical protein LBE59_06330 [Nevskiaceae bacterium]|jgi:hypothetical protein|nr:hypothetical protein [Nevskiaceae bacterium]
MKNKYAGFASAAALALFAVAGLTLATPAAAQVGRVAPPAVGTGDCDRACLEGFAEQFVKAVIAHDPKMLPLSKGVRYSENGFELPIPDGFFMNATGAEKYRMYVSDPQWGSIVFFSKMLENGAPVLVTTRLKVFARQITEIEVIVAQRRLPSSGGGAPTDVLGDTPRPEFTTTVPPEKRRSREELMNIVNTYFTGIEDNRGDQPPIFSSKCHRLEDGVPTSNVPLQPGREPSSQNYSCIEGIAKGYHRNDNRLRSRRILAVDLERQVVVAGVYFDHQNSAYIRSYQTNDGRTVVVRDTMPTTLGVHEAFTVDEEGISQVEAVFTSVPYGSRPYFSTGFRMDSEMAIKEGYVEWQ